jgi:polysaccharide biosynthesis/export protein
LLKSTNLGFFVIDSVIIGVGVIIHSMFGENQMWSQRVQQLSVLFRYYCATFCLLSIVLTGLPVQAQSQSAKSGIDGLIEQLGELGVKAETLSGQLGIGSAVDGARQNAIEGFARSPFSRTEDGEHPVLKTKMSVGELLLVGRFCKGTTSSADDQVLAVLGEFSGIERDYCRRVSDRILQIGYDVFDGTVNPDLLVNGAISDEYVLGIGDELVVTFEGKENRSINVNVDREGRVIHESIGRLPAAGRTFAKFREDLQRLTAKTRFGTEVYISMGAIRLFTVRITGEVRNPGLHQVTGLSSLYNLISMAGGIKKTGSLRRIQVQRGDKLFWLDAYELMFSQFGGQDHSLQDGDHILVSPVGKTVAITGDVKRAGIYELREGQTDIAIVDALALAGGFIRQKGNALSIMTFDSSGREYIRDIDSTNAKLEDGDILVVKRKHKSTIGTVSIGGHVSNPGKKSLASLPTLQALLMKNNSFKNNPYLLFGVLETTDPSTYARRYFPINLQDIVSGKKNYTLRDKDHLIVFSQEEIRYLSSDEVREVISDVPDTAPEKLQDDDESRIQENAKFITSQFLQKVQSGENQSGGAQPPRRENNLVEKSEGRSRKGIQYTCLGLRSLATILRFSRSGRFASVVQALGNKGNFKSVNPRPCPTVYNSNPDLLPFVLEHSVAVNGEVRIPGAYPITAGTAVSSILAVVGGMTIDADPKLVEISRFSRGRVLRQNYDFTKTIMHKIDVTPGDVVRFNAIFKARDTGPVLLSGEFVRPGLYDIRRGERLSEVFARAGGITDQAYPYGSVFTRERVRLAEKAGFKRAARELKASAMYSAGKAGVNTAALVALQNLTDEISNTESLGRVVIEADPTVLQVRPELDTVLEPGDRVFMPKRPNSVLVIGDILNPGALQFISGTKVDEYVQQAGGLQVSADEDRMFLVYPNGVAQPVSVSVWNYNPVQVPPGSTVVVPKDPVPLNIFEFAKDMTVLLSQMAITAASLAVIGNN